MRLCGLHMTQLSAYSVKVGGKKQEADLWLHLVAVGGAARNPSSIL